MIIGKITLAKNENSKLTSIKFKRSTWRYVKNIFASGRLYAIDTRKQLSQIENYIQKEFGCNKSIKIILKEIISKISIDPEGQIILTEHKHGKQSIETLYQLLTYGNLDIPRCQVLISAIQYAKMDRQCCKLFVKKSVRK